MKETIYIATGDFSLAKKGDAISFASPDPDRDGEKRTRLIPTASIDAIEFYGNATITTPILQLCNEIGVPIYFNTYNGVPTGVFYPESGRASIIKLAQYKACNDPGMKLHVAKAIVRKATRERLRIIGKFCPDETCDPLKEDMLRFRDSIDDVAGTPELRGIEGNIMRSFFDAFGRMLKHLPFDGRSRQPPSDEANAVLGFGNVMLYNATRNEVYRSSLDPLAGFLHDPHENRASLAIDIAEIFRPIIVDNLILRLDHRRTLTPSHFDKDEFKCYLSRDGKKIWLQEFFDFMHSTIDYAPLQRKVSVKEEMRIECYNLIKYITGETSSYEPVDFNNE